MSPHVIIVGAGPAGLLLAHIFARQGIQVSLLEMHQDFDRDFRGDTLHAATLEILEQLGLVEDVLKLPHEKMFEGTLHTGTKRYTIARFSRLQSTYPYIALMPQSVLLDYLDTASATGAHYRCLRGAAVNQLIYTDERVTGVAYRKDGAQHELHGDLVIAADGRFSRLRKLAKLPVESDALPTDIAWCRVSKPAAGFTADGGIHIHDGSIVVLLPREEVVQLGCVFAKNNFREIKQAGLTAFQKRIATAVPKLANQVHEIDHWDRVHLLKISSDCLTQWHRPGLLLIGDAAHVMSPVGGVGINCAIADAVATANILSRPLLDGSLSETDLAAIHKRRYRPTRLLQRGQAQILRRIGGSALNQREFVPPLPLRILLRIPGLRNLPARFAAYGVQPELLSADVLENLMPPAAVEIPPP